MCDVAAGTGPLDRANSYSSGSCDMDFSVVHSAGLGVSWRGQQAGTPAVCSDLHLQRSVSRVSAALLHPVSERVRIRIVTQCARVPWRMDCK
jgi:hypothetical protein